jgi:hypothetical protein
MKVLVGFVGLFLLTGGLGTAQQQPADNAACGFAVQGEPAHAAVVGPDDLVPLVYVVEQPDSPLEILSVDLDGMWLSVADERHQEHMAAKYRIRNRSDRTIQNFDINLTISTGGSLGGGIGIGASSSLAPGQTVEITAGHGNGDGGAPGNHVKLLVFVDSVEFNGCHYAASLRLPRSLGVHDPWQAGSPAGNGGGK